MSVQYIKVENSGYVNQVQADPRIIFDNHGQAYQVQDNPNHGYVNQDQTGPNHGYINQVQTGPNSYHGYINQDQENHGYINQVETGPNHGYITQVQTGQNSYHGYINQVQENSGDNNQVQTENSGNVNTDQTGPNHGYINQVQNGPTRGAEPGMLAHHPILKAVEAKPVPSKDLHTFRRPNPKVKMENQGYNNQVQTGPTGAAEPEMLKHHPILQAVEANPVPSKDFHTFRRPYPRGKFEQRGMYVNF
jgi:hypothetical protein